MNTPFFTIITPCLNAGEKLGCTLESILMQTFTDYEVIVKDALSTDTSIDSIPADVRIRLVRGADNGIYDGMNAALPLASGEYLYFLNCGDVLHDQNVLADVAEYIQKERNQAKSPPQGDILYGDVIEMKTGQHVAANPHMTHLAMYRNLPCHQACFYSRELFRDRGFCTSYRVRADYEHFLWCVIEKEAAAIAIPRIICDYEGGGFSETPENIKASQKEHEEITGHYFRHRELVFFRLYMILTLQPLRKKLAQSPATAALYDGIKNRIYGRKNHL